MKFQEPYKMSLERLIPKPDPTGINKTAGHYMPGNVALVICELNGKYQWTVEKRTDLVSLYDSRNLTQAVPNVTVELLKNPPKNVTNIGKNLSIVNFTNVLDVLRYKFDKSRARTTDRNRKGRKHEFNITVQFLVDLFVKQGGRCAHSGIPFPMNNQTWSISIDRIVNSIGYIEGNVRLVIQEFNVNASYTTESFANIANGIKSVLEASVVNCV